MIWRKTVLTKSVIGVLTIMTCIGCNGTSNTDTFSDSGTLLQDPLSSNGSPVGAGEGFVFGVVGLYSGDPLAIVDVSLVNQGETPRLNVLHNGSARHPFRHPTGLVTVTEPCRTDESSVIEYRRISVLTADGGTNPLTPCSYQIATPGGFTWINQGRLSPNGQLLAAQLDSPEDPPISVVFENGQEIARYSGYANPAWLNDDTLVLIGSRIVTVRLGEEPIIVSDEVTGLSIGTLAVSPDGSRFVFEWQRALWLMNVDGSGLRMLLPENQYVFPAWSPDGRWVATMQRLPVTAVDVQIATSTGYFSASTILAYFTLVNVETGAQFTADVSMHLDDSQMPQGALSWY